MINGLKMINTGHTAYANNQSTKKLSLIERAFFISGENQERDEFALFYSRNGYANFHIITKLHY